MPNPNTAILNQTSDAADANVGVIQYNGYKLCPARSYTFTVEPVYDRSGRTITSRKFLLKGTFLVYAGDNISAPPPTVARESTAMQSIRDALSVPGQDLILTGIGFGDMKVGNNQGNGFTRDVNFGPKPQVLSCDPVGCLMAWEVDWTIQWELAYVNSSGGGVLNPYAVIAFNYETETTVDYRGLTTRTISGYWQIAQSGLPGARITPASALKDQLLIGVPKGFRRRSQKFKDNDAKNICTFSYVDEELSGRAFPEGIVEADVDYELENDNISFSKWRATLSGTLESKPGAPRTLATEKFMAIVLDKVSRLRAAFFQKGNFGCIIPEKIRVKGGMYHRRYSFSFTFRVTGCLKDIISASGMYSALPDSNWERWRASLQEVWSPGGTTGLSTPLEAIFSTGNSLNNYGPQATATGYTDKADKFSHVFDADPNKNTIGEEDSWLEFENYIRAVKTSAFEIQKIAQEVAGIAGGFATGYAGGKSASFFIDPSKVGAFFESKQPDAPKADKIKYTGKSTQYILMYGKAMRLKYPINIPLLAKVGDGKAVCVDQEIEPSVQVGVVGTDDVPVFVARWAKLYHVPEGYAQYIPASENPVHCPIPGTTLGMAVG